MNELIISNIGIGRDAEGRYCLNDLHQAAGGEQRHQSRYWLANQQAHELIQEVMGDSGNPLSVQRGGSGQGTYVIKELIIAYAAWISPAFHLRVIRAYEASVMQVLNDPAVMRGLLLTYSDKAIVLEGQVAEMCPQVEAFERIAVADGSLCIQSAAKHLQMRPSDLFRWLQEHPWIYRRAGGGWLAYQDRIQRSYLEHKITTVERSDGSTKITEQCRVTPNGLASLAQRLSSKKEVA